MFEYYAEIRLVRRRGAWRRSPAPSAISSSRRRVALPSPRRLSAANVPSRLLARDTYLHGLVRRRASAPPPRCSSTTTYPHSHPRGATLPAAILQTRRSLLPAARGRVCGRGPQPPIRPRDAECRPRIFVAAIVRRRRCGRGGSSGLCIVLCCVTVLICNTQHNTQKKVFCWTQNF